MDIEMIQFTGLLSIMLLFGWILITVFFIIVTESTNGTDEKIKNLKKNGGNRIEKDK